MSPKRFRIELFGLVYYSWRDLFKDLASTIFLLLVAIGVVVVVGYGIWLRATGQPTTRDGQIMATQNAILQHKIDDLSTQTAPKK